jgi:xanthine/CO dehydrogenase XdhC/CoxF family maturation factor
MKIGLGTCASALFANPRAIASTHEHRRDGRVEKALEKEMFFFVDLIGAYVRRV